MKKLYRYAAIAIAAISISAGNFSANAQVTSMLGDVLGNLVEGVFSKSNLTLNDVCGEWTAKGSAVTFKSDNLLEKAGGLAAAGAIENKIDPYYKKLGLDKAVLTIKDDGTFTLKAKMSLSGTVTSNDDGTFEFDFKAMKSISLGKVTAYVTKSGNNLDVMFDATKLKKVVSAVAGVTGLSTAKTIAKILDSYEGLCVGFKMKKTGEVESTNPSSSTTSEEESTAKEATKSTSSKLGGALFDILNSKTSK